MKRCPECRRDYYDDRLLFCLDDGTELLEGPASADENPETVKMHPAASLGGKADHDAATRLYPAGDRTSTEIRRRPASVLLIVGVVLVALAGLAYGLYRFLDKKETARTTVNLKSQRLTGDGKVRGGEISPDGRFLAYLKVEGSERSIWLKQIKTQTNIPIVQGGDLSRADNFAFTPDGEFLYFNAQPDNDQPQSIYRVPTLGGTPTKVLTNATAIQFSPDGRQISFARFDLQQNENAVYIANTDGSNERRIANKGGTTIFDGVAAWSPDGKTLAVASGDDARAPEPLLSVSLLNVDSGEEKELGGARWVGVDDLVWHPSGDSIILAATDSPFGLPQLWEVSYPSGDVRRITDNLNGHYSVSITADGASLVTGELFSRSAVWVSPDLKPENAKQVMPSTGDTWGLSWTPDNRIVYVSDQTGDPELWIMDAEGKNAKALTSDRLFKTTPVVSPDGRYILYTSGDGGGTIVRINIDGSNRVDLNKAAGADNPDISRDGKWVIFSAYVDGKQRILRVPIDGGPQQSLTEYNATEPRYSRDGTRFACFIANEKSLVWNRLAIVPADGGEPIKVFDSPLNTNIGRGPIWTPDDKGITLVVAPGEKQDLWLQPVDGGSGKQMTDFEVPGIARREYSRDGKRIAIVRAEGVGNAIMITGFR